MHQQFEADDSGPATEPTPEPTPAPEARDVNAVVRDLARDVAMVTGQRVDACLPFAAKFGPLALKWERDRKAAEAIGNAEVIAVCDEDRRQLRVAVVLEAGALGVKLQQTLETRLLAAFDVALGR